MGRQKKVKKSVAGCWARWSEYRCRTNPLNGELLIGPAPGARMKWYSPWKVWERVRKTNGESPDYERAMSVYRRLEIPEGDSAIPKTVTFWTHRRRKLLLELASQIGLTMEPFLGISGILTWPRLFWSVGNGLWHFASPTCSRSPTDHSAIGFFPPGFSRANSAKVRVDDGKPGDPLRVLPPDFPDPRIEFNYIRSMFPAKRPIDWLARFFPHTDGEDLEMFLYPMPYTPEWWRLYHEPVKDFVGALRSIDGLLSGAIRELKDNEGIGGSVLASRATNLQLVSEIQDGKMKLTRKGYTLLDTWALMILTDLSGGRCFVHCPECGIYATKKSPRALYCSKKCAGRSRQRKHRNQSRARDEETHG